MYRLVYFPWIAQHLSQSEIHYQVEAFAEEIGLALRSLNWTTNRVTVLPPADVPQQVDLISTGGAEIGLMNPLGFALARRRSRRVKAVAIAERVICGVTDVSYTAQLYARRDSALSGLESLRGLSIGYGTACSTSSFLMPAHLLLKAGIHPFLGFAKVEFLGNHDVIAKAILRGDVVCGAGHCGVIEDLSRQAGFQDACDVLVTLEETGPIPSDPVAIRLDEQADEDILEAAVLAAATTPRGKLALSTFWGQATGLRSCQAGTYDHLLDVLQDLNISEAYLLAGLK